MMIPTQGVRGVSLWRRGRWKTTLRTLGGLLCALWGSVSCTTHASHDEALGEVSTAVDPFDPAVQFASCRVCHGTQEMQRGPILDGLPAWYVRAQLLKFQQGIRGGVEENRSELLMTPAISQLEGEGSLERISEFIARLPAPRHLSTVRGDVERGEQLFPLCALCHGVEGQGNAGYHAPPLTIQEDWYLLDQMRKFRSQLRGHHVEDLEGRLMWAVTSTLELRDVRDLVAYIEYRLKPQAASKAK